MNLMHQQQSAAPLSDPEPQTRRRTAQGEQTRQAILRVAVDIASIEGLEGLSIGRLAAELGMSKSGLFAHFGSKEDLQLETIEVAKTIFSAEVIRPALAAQAGMARLVTLCRSWFSYGERQVFRGGCFFAAAVLEFDGRPGRVRDRLAETMKKWLNLLTQLIQQAQDVGEIDPKVDSVQLAFEIHALFWGANWMFQLQDDQYALTRAKTAILQRLESVATIKVEAD
jgi:AcrR family transcriptional regulator